MVKLKTLLILLLFTMTAYSAPPDHANNPDGDDMPDQANCIFCDDDQPDPETPNKHKAVLWLGALALGLSLTHKNKRNGI